MSLTILLPTYNEAENINPLILAIRKHVPKTDILVVDDNSPDGTAKKVKNARVLLRTKNRGLTNSLRDGIKASKTDFVGWMDCDFSHPPGVLPTLIKEVERGAAVAIATRNTYPLFSKIINGLCMLFFGFDIHDYTTGFLVARRSVLDAIPLRGNYGEYCIDLLVRAKRKGYRIEEIPYDSPPRKHGASKTSLTYGLGYLSTVWGLLWTSDR
ncbi:MAG TPA: glycosyltransferase [Patescibacteria group bacterium]|nr:glycosyltransferase [Patescibacteria group bacterium]